MGQEFERLGCKYGADGGWSEIGGHSREREQ